jgi:steroid delta-isomerase
MSPKASVTDTQEIECRTRSAIERYVEAWRTSDRQALLDVFAEDAVWEDPVGTPPWRGHAGVGAFWDRAHGGGATLTPKVTRIIVCGREGILVFRMIVRTGDGGGMGLDVCDHMQVNDAGKIQVARAYWDQQCVVPLSEC